MTGAFHVTSKQSSENTGKGATLQQSSQRGCLFVSRLRLHNEVDLLNSTAAVPSFRLDRYSESRQSVHFFERRFECALIEWVPALKLFRSEEHTSELQSLMRISYAVLCLKKK